MSRNLDPTLVAEYDKQTIRPIWIIRLDILNDPVLVWTGRGTFNPVGTGDTALDGQSFLGLGSIGSIDAIQDTDSGSGAVTLTLPGISSSEPLLSQLLTSADIWRFRNAYIWTGLLDESSSIIVNPFRVKTGRMDNMRATDDGTEATIQVTIESHQAFAGQALDTRYSEQKDIDSTDTSQNYIHDLANKRPGIGVATPNTGSGGGRGSLIPGGHQFRF